MKKMTTENSPENLTEKTRKPQDKILELVNWVEENEKQLFRWRDVFYHLGWLLLLLSVVTFGIPELMIFINATNPEKIIVLLSIVAILLAFLSMVTQVSERNIVEARTKHALKIRAFNEREKPLLKALIKIKSKNTEQKLSILYAIDKEANGNIFTEKNLLEILCK